MSQVYECQWKSVTVETAMRDAVSEVNREGDLARREELFGDREQLTGELIMRISSHAIKTDQVAGTPAYMVLEERLRKIPLL